MNSVSNKSEAIEVATSFLRMKSVQFARCLGAVKVASAQFELWKDIIEGGCGERRDLWQVDYEKRILSENVVNTGNSFSVFVDSRSRRCGIFWGM